MLRSSLSFSFAVAIATLVVATNARAADGDADALFREGNALVQSGRYADACPKLAESQKIEPAVGTQFNLADCYEHLGRTATAHALFSEVARIARAAGKFERERLAKERVAALEPKLGHLRLIVKSPAPGIEIKIDDAVVSTAAASSAAPPAAIDAGHHRVVATAPSRTAWEGAFDTKDGATSELVIPELVDPNPKPRASGVEPPPKSSTQRTIAIAVAGAGVAGLIVGAVGGALSLSARSSAKDSCPEATYHFHCPTQQGTDDWNAATTTGNVSTVGFVVGGVAIAAAAVLWFTAPSSSKSSPNVRAGVAANGLRFEGSF